jgi:hypothetical protein
MPAAQKGLETALDFCFEQSDRFRRTSGRGAPSEGGTACQPIYQSTAMEWNSCAEGSSCGTGATGCLNGKFTKYCLTRGSISVTLE